MRTIFLILFLATTAYADPVGSIENICSKGKPISATLANTLTDTTSTQLIAAQGTNNRVYLTNVTVTNSDASVGTVVKILSGSTTKLRNYAGITGGGFATSEVLQGAKNTAWNIQAETTSAELTATVSGCVVYDSGS